MRRDRAVPAFNRNCVGTRHWVRVGYDVEDAGAIDRQESVLVLLFALGVTGLVGGTVLIGTGVS